MKIAILFPSFLGGGAEAVCAWILEALKERDVTLVTLSDVRLKALDEQYGTSLAGTQVRVLRVPIPLPSQARELVVKSLSAFSVRQFYLSWYYRKYLANNFDLAISAFNEMDLGRRGIQYIHAPLFGEGHERIHPHLGHPDSMLRRAYKWLLRRLSGYSEDRMRSNVTVVNSQWTTRWVEQLYNIQPKVIYPPVFLCRQEKKDWKERLSGFVVVGRAVRHRRLERAVCICSKVREAGFDVRLYIVAGSGDMKYLEELKRLTSQTSWITLSSFLPRKEYSEILGNYKWGIHTMENEPWGIVVAEMVQAGLIPFVPAQGGAAEIVGNHELLVWDDEEDAARKIIEVLSNEHLQKDLHRYLGNIGEKFSAERFIAQIQLLVEDFSKGTFRS